MSLNRTLVSLLLLPILSSCGEEMTAEGEKPDEVIPAVVGAASTSNTTVYVSFSEPMDESAAVSTNYVITQEVVNPEVGTITVNDAYFPKGDSSHTAVVLHTSPQNEVTYRIKAVDIDDANGNPIPGVIRTPSGVIDTSSTTFAGSARGLVELTVESDGAGGVSGWSDTNMNGVLDSGDSLKDAAGNSIVLADRDSDGVIDNWEDKDGNGTVTPGDTVSGFQDTDGDGLSDSQELRGVKVKVEKSKGEWVEYEVTSDPTKADTDGDRLSDITERRLGTNPRKSDTDSDGLSDYPERNVIYSKATSADTDGDGIGDGREFNELQTSPIHADTDGDQLTDDVELYKRFRNPRIADLPTFGIVPGNHTIILNEVYTYTDSSGSEVSVQSSSSAQVGTSSANSIIVTDQSVHETVLHVGGEALLRGGISEQNEKHFILGQATFFANWKKTDIGIQGADKSVTREAQQVLEESYNKGETLTASSDVARAVENAVINLEVNLRNKGDIAFSVQDIEVTMLQRRPGTKKLEPLATLLPRAGSNAVYHLGPFEREIGPIVFSDENFPVAAAEALMRDPRGIVFRVANYAIVDEFGRQFTFINQQVTDVTAGLVIDYGFEGVERHQIAVSGMRDPASGDAIGTFDANGRPTGLPLTFLLQNQLGWERNPTTKDAIIAGIEGIAQTAALGDDVQKVAVGTRGLGLGEVIIEAGPNGILDSTTDPNSHNRPAITRGFDTSLTCGTDAPVIFQGSKACSAASECTCTEANGCPPEVLANAQPGNDGFANAQCDGPNIITRVGGYENRPGSYRWVALTDADLSTSADVDSIRMKPGESFKLAFVQDLDKDGLFARQEFAMGTTDSPVNSEDNTQFGDTYRLPVAGSPTACGFQVLPFFCGDEAIQSVRIPLADSRDTDRDGMEDATEQERGWEVAPNGQSRRQVYSLPTLRDSDGDGLTDWQERDIRFSCAQRFYVAGKNRTVDGVYFGPLRRNEVTFNENTIVGYPAAYENQRLIFTGPFDAAIAPTEALIPDDLTSAAMAYGTVNANDPRYIENVAPYCRPDVLDLSTADPNDYISRAVALDPQDVDTDGDGVDDGVEIIGYEVNRSVKATFDFDKIVAGSDPVLFHARGDDVLVRQFSATIKLGDVILLPGPNGQFDADYAALYVRDTDFRLGVSLLAETNPTRIRSNPLEFDTDGDGVSDGAERSTGSNPVVPGDVGNLLDSDGDGVFDIDESRGLNITVNGVGEVVRSNPTIGDTDGDGLPDFVEYQVGSNPSRVDTDADGLGDYDELSAHQFSAYAGYVKQFENFSLDASTSMTYGTRLDDSDSDNDGIPDGGEVTGFTIDTLQGGVPVTLTVETNPLTADTDGDGLTDAHERDTAVGIIIPPRKTNPLASDSDGDGKDDGHDSIPLTANRSVTVDLVSLGLFDSVEANPDWEWELHVLGPWVSAWTKDTRASTHINYFTNSNNCPLCTFTTRANSPLGAWSTGYLNIPNQYFLARPLKDKPKFNVMAGESFAVAGTVLQYDFDGINNRHLYPCQSDFLKRFSYADIAYRNAIDGTVDLSQGRCSVQLRYTVHVN